MRRNWIMALIYGLFSLFVVLLPLSSQENKFQRLESRLVDSFDGSQAWGPNDGLYPNGDPVVWQTRGSKYTEEGFPALQMVAGSWPIALRGVSPDEPESFKVLGVRSQFKQRGYNYIEVLPGRVVDGEWREEVIPLEGQVQQVDLWVWGSNYDYTLEGHFTTAEGTVEVFYFNLPNVRKSRPGSLEFVGWQLMSLEVPPSVKQFQKYKPSTLKLGLAKLVIRTTPKERVDDFFIYFDELRVLTDVYESQYDGYELTDPDVIDDIWGTGGTTATTGGDGA